MKNRTINKASYISSIIMLAIFLIPTGDILIAREGTGNPVADVFRVMELASDSKIDKLWPGFMVDKIPVLVYDSLNTYLFNSHNGAEGFVESDINHEVYVFKGQHPLVRGNSIVRMGDNWTATSVLSSSSRRTGEKYDLKDMAGIIVHEQFHIFQRTNHPGWLQNDGLLLIYPEETVEALLLRRMEKEAFKRAVIADTRDQVAGWVKLGMQKRKERLDLVPYEFANYENELQLSEGLSDYIEKRARDQHPHAAMDITNGIAPAGIRDLGYVEGRWMAMILDSLKPGWKLYLEENDSLYLEDILNELVDKLPFQKKAFGPQEMDKMKEDAEKDFMEWQERKKSEIEGFYEMPGYSIEFRSSDDPFVIRLFEPLEIEILDDGGVYHRLIFMAGNESGSLRGRTHPCITWFNNAYRITRLMINGLQQEPEINENEKKLTINENGVSIQLNYSGVRIDNNRFIVDL
jgi:hypothetical protein